VAGHNEVFLWRCTWIKNDHKCCSRRRIRDKDVSEKHFREKNTFVCVKRENLKHACVCSSEGVRRNNRAAQREMHIEGILNCFFTK